MALLAMGAGKAWMAGLDRLEVFHGVSKRVVLAHPSVVVNHEAGCKVSVTSRNAWGLNRHNGSRASLRAEPC
jgi:hypothetical protein